MILRFLDRGLTAVCAAGAILLLVLLFAGPSLIGAKKTNAAPYPGTAGADPGAQAFASAGCGGCHTLKAAGASGSIGPNLDSVRPDAATVAAIVRSGAGTMPSFKGRLSDGQIAAVARYVARVAGR